MNDDNLRLWLAQGRYARYAQAESPQAEGRLRRLSLGGADNTYNLCSGKIVF